MINRQKYIRHAYRKLNREARDELIDQVKAFDIEPIVSIANLLNQVVNITDDDTIASELGDVQATIEKFIDQYEYLQNYLDKVSIEK